MLVFDNVNINANTCLDSHSILAPSYLLLTCWDLYWFTLVVLISMLMQSKSNISHKMFCNNYQSLFTSFSPLFIHIVQKFYYYWTNSEHLVFTWNHKPLIRKTGQNHITFTFQHDRKSCHWTWTREAEEIW